MSLAPLTTTEISKHKGVFQKFSCLRNVPQCNLDKPATSTCMSSCTAVTTSINQWIAQCETTAKTKAIQCLPFGSVRDCDGTKAAEAGDFPRLCTAFQQEMQGDYAAGTVQIKAFSALVLVL